MTCIVGLRTSKGVIVGADSAASNSNIVSVRLDRKIVKVGPYIFGFTTSYRLGQVIGYSWKPPKPRGNIFNFMVGPFANSLRKSLKNAGCLERKQEVEEGLCFIVAYNKRLFTVYSDFQIEELEEDFAAIGSGAEYAIGSLYTTDMMELSGHEVVEVALQAAAKYNPYVRAPFILEQTW